MKTVRKLIFSEIIRAVIFVSLAFLALFVFFDVVDELRDLGKGASESQPGGYRVQHLLLYVLLSLPNRLYDLLPITVLIGSVFVMARFAQTSEFTILRTSGLGPVRALKTLFGLGLGIVLFTFLVGDYIAPAANRSAQLLKTRFKGDLSIGQTGAWLREKQLYSTYAVNVGALSANGDMRDIRLIEFSNNGQLRSITHAQQGQFAEGSGWQLSQVTRREILLPQSAIATPANPTPQNPAAEPTDAAKPAPTTEANAAKIEMTTAQSLFWPSGINAEMVSVALLKPSRMSTINLYQYMRHLQANQQDVQLYAIEFWRKLFYPISCMVMLALALPFAYIHFRSSAIAFYVFLGVLIGISFFVANNVVGYFGNVNGWSPLLTAAAPSLIYSVISMGAFSWLVMRH